MVGVDGWAAVPCVPPTSDTFDVLGESNATDDEATASTNDVVKENTVPSAKLTRATSGVSVVVVILPPPPDAEGGVPGTTIVETPSCGDVAETVPVAVLPPSTMVPPREGGGSSLPPPPGQDTEGSEDDADDILEKWRCLDTS